jgi:hypothetical protein
MTIESGKTQKGATVGCPFCNTLNRVDLSRLKDRPTCTECTRPLLLDRPIPVSDQNFGAAALVVATPTE